MDELRWVERWWICVGCGVGEPVEVAEDAADRPWLLLLFLGGVGGWGFVLFLRGKGDERI